MSTYLCVCVCACVCWLACVVARMCAVIGILLLSTVQRPTLRWTEKIPEPALSASFNLCSFFSPLGSNQQMMDGCHVTRGLFFLSFPLFTFVFQLLNKIRLENGLWRSCKEFELNHLVVSQRLLLSTGFFSSLFSTFLPLSFYIYIAVCPSQSIRLLSRGFWTLLSLW